MTNITFVLEASPNTKPKEKKVGVMVYYVPPRLKKWGEHVLRVPHQIVPMIAMSAAHIDNIKTIANETLPPSFVTS